MSQPDLLAPFHLAIPVDDLITAAAFYEGVLGCCRGRESAEWIDLNFFGHQVVLHQATKNPGREAFVNPVDSELIPVPHFGVVLDHVAFEALENRVRSSKTDLLSQKGLNGSAHARLIQHRRVTHVRHCQDVELSMMLAHFCDAAVREEIGERPANQEGRH